MVKENGRDASKHIYELLDSMVEKIGEATGYFVFNPKKCKKILTALHDELEPHADDPLVHVVRSTLKSVRTKCSINARILKQIEKPLAAGEAFSMEHYAVLLKHLENKLLWLGHEIAALKMLCMSYEDELSLIRAKRSRGKAQEKKVQNAIERRERARHEIRRRLETNSKRSATDLLGEMAGEMNSDGKPAWGSLSSLKKWCKGMMRPQ